MMNETIFINLIAISRCQLLIKAKELYLSITHIIMYACIMNILIDFYHLLTRKLSETANRHESLVKYTKY